MVSIYERIIAYRNLETAFRNARKGKSKKKYVLDFERSLESNLLTLQIELEQHAYKPKPLESFILRDPKTRTISRSDFRDRVVHHALCNIIEPIIDKKFISDSFANRKGKGTLKAIERFESFARKVSHNLSRAFFVLKADVRKYFDTVDHRILLGILSRHIQDERVLWLCKSVLDNFHTRENKGMPLGNLTSQFFANVYLNELDQFVKHALKVKQYVRYVDDFVIVHHDIADLERWKRKIDSFLLKELALTLHPQKSTVIKGERGIDFLGFRIFEHYRLLRKRNVRKFFRRWSMLKEAYDSHHLSIDEFYDGVQGWVAYAQNANTRALRSKVTRDFNQTRSEISQTELNQQLKEK